MTTATVTTWPTAAQLQRVNRLIVRAYNALDELHLEYAAIAREADALDDATRLPTFEELGRLSAFIAGADQDLRIMREDFLGDCREAHDAAGMRMADAR
jgi:hypothetical protein